MVALIISLLMTGICVGTSAMRLRFVLQATHYHPSVLQEALRGDMGRRRAPKLTTVVQGAAPHSWESELIEAMHAATPQARAARVNELLTELDHRLSRWARVPRVCASIASSSGFLLASLALRNGLLEADTSREVVDAAVMAAIEVASAGILGTVGCIAIQMRARAEARARLRETDKLVERLEAVLVPAVAHV